MLADAAMKIGQLAGEEAWVLIGGIDVVASALRGRLDKKLMPRSEVASFDVHDNEARLAALRAKTRHPAPLGECDWLMSMSRGSGRTGRSGDRIDRALLTVRCMSLLTSTSSTKPPRARPRPGARST